MHDSHIHLALEPLKTNIQEIIQNFLQDNGKYILTQGTDIQDFNDTLNLASLFPSNIQVALGLHPTFFEESTIEKGIFKDIFQKSKKKIDLLEETILKEKNKISAIGETGLDYYQIRLNKDISGDMIEQIKEIQKISFRKHIILAKDLNLPVSIHARDVNGGEECVKDVMRILAEEGKGLIKGSFHSYTGSIELVDDILDLGFHIGFNAIITYNSGGDVRDILKRVPLERILFETDGPFLPPQSVRKDKKIKEKFAQPSHIREILGTASEVKEVDPKYLEQITDESYERIFLSK
ncbi:MAG: TatD family hydrolase [Candidatus Dojkabacteria bacterium]